MVKVIQDRFIHDLYTNFLLCVAIQRRFPRYNTIDYNYERMVMLVVPGGVSTIHCLNIVWRAMSGPIINNYSFMMFVSGLIIDCIDFYVS